MNQSSLLLRYVNMDYFFFQSLRHNPDIDMLKVSYDIACQWSHNFRKRQEDLPENLRLPAGIQMDVAIPSWHINGHGQSCQDTFHVGYLNGVGQLCGVEVEQTWWSTNALGSSVREMGPGSRHKTMNNHWNAFNSHKIVGFCMFLHHRSD